MHQAAEYLIGGAFVASGLQSPKPLVPTLMGGLIMANTACSKGPLSAFRVFGKRIHRLLDAVLVVLTIAAAVQPFVEIDNGTRGIMALLAVCMGVIWLQSDFTERVKQPAAVRGGASTAPGVDQPRGATTAASARPGNAPDGSTADLIGRTAGRLAGKGVNIYRSRKAAGQRRSG
jgi:hypothetical protein